MDALRGKVAIVTGGASGIGKALGEELAARGAEVVLADRQADVAEEVARGIRSQGGRARGVALDVRDLGAFRRLASAVHHDAGHVDFLFNNAGIGIGGEVDALEPEDWDETLDVNVRGVVNGIQAVYPLMVAQRSGHVVNTASVAGLVAMPGSAPYAASKHAVVGLTKSLRVEARRHGVRASVLCPGAIRTPILTGGKYGRMKGVGSGLPRDAILALWERARPMAPEALARAAVDATLRDEAIIVLPRFWKLLWWLERLSPDATMAVLGRSFAAMRRELDAARGKAPEAARGAEATTSA